MFQDGYSIYKPLKNLLGKLGVQESLFVIWAYSRYQQFGSRIPEGIEIPSGYLQSSRHSRNRVCAPWELETLCKLVIAESGDWPSQGQDLCRVKCFSRVLNRLKETENQILKLYLNDENILVELFRIAHRQFPWQDTVSKVELARYYSIFTDQQLAVFIERVLGISVESLYMSGFCLFSLFLHKPYVDGPIDTSGLSLKEGVIQIDKFLGLFSRAYMDLRTSVISEIDYDDKFAYSNSSVRAYPIIRMGPRAPNRLICPLPSLLLWQLTGALYYKILDEIGNQEESERKRLMGDFGNLYGQAFQRHVEEVLSILAAKWGTRYLPEEQYLDGKNVKRTIDFAVYDQTAALFIECKTKRIRYPAKIELTNKEIVETDLRAVAAAIVQMYKSIDEYKKSKYSHKYTVCGDSIFPLLVTLEPLYIFEGTFGKRILELVVEGMLLENIDEKYLEEFPYSWCSFDELPNILQIASKKGIKPVIEGKVRDKEHKTWQYFSYLSSCFPNEIEQDFYLEERFNSIFTRHFGEDFLAQGGRGMNN